jgi:hypothetical protein
VRAVESFSCAIACVGAPHAISIPSRAEVIAIDTPRARFGGRRATPLPTPYAFDERFVFTHYVGDVDGGFLLGDEP